MSPRVALLCHTYVAEQVCHTYVAEQVCHTYVAEQVCHTYVAEQVCHTYVAEQSGIESGSAAIHRGYFGKSQARPRCPAAFDRGPRLPCERVSVRSLRSGRPRDR